MSQFDFNDFRSELGRMKSMGSTRDLLRKIPGLEEMEIESLSHDQDEEVTRVLAMIDSMTTAERQDPGLIDRSRQRRIAAGSSTDPGDVSRLIEQFDLLRSVIKAMDWRRNPW
jgi:signal recognition particle subunit SRP54